MYLFLFLQLSINFDFPLDTLLTIHALFAVLYNVIVDDEISIHMYVRNSDTYRFKFGKYANLSIFRIFLYAFY